MAMQPTLKAKRARPWAPRQEIAPVTRKGPHGELVAASNGSAGCYGGWDVVYPVPPSEYIKVRIKARWDRLERSFDSVQIGALWEGDKTFYVNWEPLLPTAVRKDHVVYEALVQVSHTAKELVVRSCLAWSATGEIRFFDAEVRPCAKPRPRRWRLGAAGTPHPIGTPSVESNTRLYLDLGTQAAAAGVYLLCLPEVMLQWGLPCDETTMAPMAIGVPGKEIEPFQKLAQKEKMALCFSVFERDKELVHNTALLIDKGGNLVGKYRKVHLAPPLEIWWGVTPGHDFPVFDLHGAKVCMNICMDSSALESARVPARRGAEILLMPIMGDHRAVSEWRWGYSDFDVKRWCEIQSVRAMDNQIHMVISRNSGYGSGVFSPTGEVLALSGGKTVVWADVDLNDPPRTTTGATFRGVCWFERREPTYGPMLGKDMRDPFENVES